MLSGMAEAFIVVPGEALDGRTWTVDTRTDTWVQRACKTAGRNLTRGEWKQFFPNRPYQVTCRQWPAGV